MTINDFRKDLEKRKLENQVFLSQIDKENYDIVENVRKLGCVKDALKIIEGIALEKRNGIKTGIEMIVTESLRSLYGPEYSFDMSYTEKANRSCLEMRVLKQTEMGTVRRQMDGFGGGVSDSISVPLRLMVLKGSDTGDILILDEAFKHVDGDMVEKVGIFLKTIKEKLGTQIIMVTHHKGLLQYADKGFELKNENGSVKN